MQNWSSFVDVLLRRAEADPHVRAYTFLDADENESQLLTHGELDRRARAIAATLQTRCKPGDRAVLLYPPGLDFVSAFFGCLYAGVIAVPLSPPNPMRLEQTLPGSLNILRDAGAAALLTTQLFMPMAELVPELATLQWIATDAVALTAAEAWQPARVDAETIALLQYTSGSTSQPKGVIVTHGNLLANAASIQRAMRHDRDSVGAGWLPMYHDMGLMGTTLQPLYVGFPVVLQSPLDVLAKPARWLRTVSKYRATTTGGPTFGYDLCTRRISEVEREGLELSAWRVAFVGAEHVAAGILERFAATFAPHGFRKESFLPCYGLAEATLMVTGDASTGARVFTSASGEGVPSPLVGCGPAVSGVEVAIVDAQGGAPTDGVGEIWVRGENVAKGYWQRPEASLEAFGAILPSDAGGPFLRTGDLGVWRDGQLLVVGRLKDLIVVRGVNHYAHDVEETVGSAHPSMRPGRCAAFSIFDGDDELVVVVQEVERRWHERRKQSPAQDEAYAHRRLGDRRQPEADPAAQVAVDALPDTDEIIGQIRVAVAEKHGLRLAAVVLIIPGSIPKTTSGKIRRFACRQDFIGGRLEAVSAWADERAAKLLKRS